ncbi:riboflavin synthase [Pueribacillus theae]|uniref:Riboflavin synthase n=1 Tax=Pueribacillus theae TaxID=2171751 RepID=A0A2U1K677_9BACI|nr:riboflavin synthase [Pueribacillus theae]PWA12418.1 riboflavin synthase [Pueribacillus theae]
MFTGIIEEIGKIEAMDHGADAITMKIKAKKILHDVQLGDSIAVNGVCLTVTSFTEGDFTVDVMPETVKSTSLKSLKQGSSVNLERAMAANGRFGGHFVTGHVDGIGEIRAKRPVSNAVYYEIAVPDELMSYIIYKGSIAVDGTSLTVFGVNDGSFTISLIPHTLSETVLGDKAPGDIVNIECDMLGKYVEQFTLKRKDPARNRMTKSFLEKNGFA